MTSIAILAAALSATLAATQPDAATRDGFYVEAPAVVDAGTIRVSTGGGSTVDQDGVELSTVAGAKGLWSPVRTLAVGVEVIHESDAFSPAVTLRWQFLSQANWVPNTTALVRYKSVGFNGTGSEVEAELVAGKAYDRLAFSAAGVIGKGFNGEDAVDLEGKAAASWTFSESLRAGVEARLRAEVALGTETSKPAGREYDLVAGPTIAWRSGALALQAIAGVGVPRGVGAAGPMGLALISFDL